MLNLYKLHNEKLDYYEKYNNALELLDIRLTHYGTFEPGDASVLKNVLHIIKREPNLAYRYADIIIKGRWAEVESTIMKDPLHAYAYALDIIKGRWAEAESYILKDTKFAFYYARDVIKGRWKEVEADIITNPLLARDYAENVIKERWIEAELIIKTNNYQWGLYCRTFSL